MIGHQPRRFLVWHARRAVAGPSTAPGSPDVGPPGVPVPDRSALELSHVLVGGKAPVTGFQLLSVLEADALHRNRLA